MFELLAPVAAFGAKLLPGVFSSVDDFMEVGDNKTKLKEALEELRAAKLDVEHRIEAETIRPSLKVVKNWLHKVDSVTSEAEYLLEKLDGKAAAKKLYGDVKYSRKIAKMIKKVNQLNEVQFENISSPNAPLRDKMALPVNFVCFKFYEEALNKVMQRHVYIVGVVGLRGSGVSTLLRHINNSLRTHFRNVFFIFSDPIDNIQLELAKKLGIDCGESWGSLLRHDRASLIHRALRNKEYVIIFDRLNSSIELLEIGIELVLRMRRKVIFGASDHFVCDRMEVDERISVEPLGENDAAILLFTKAAKELQTNICNNRYFKRILLLCDGNPNLLAIIGTHMRARVDDGAWKYAYEALEFASKVSLDDLVENQIDKAELLYGYACLSKCYGLFEMTPGLKKKLDGICPGWEKRAEQLLKQQMEIPKLKLE